MTDKTTETKENSEVIQKSEEDPSLNSVIAQLLKNQEKRIDVFEKRFDNIETLIKEHNKNPVDKGIEAENKPKTADPNDVGDKVTIGNDVAPVPSEAQGSIIAPSVEASSSDAPKLQMENKMEEEKKPEEKKEEKKEEVTKTEGEEKKPEEKKEEVKKSDDSEYEFVKTVRPILKGVQFDTEQKVPTGYQVLKSIISGWNGQTSSAEEALTIAYNKLERGEFGNGLPTGGY